MLLDLRTDVRSLPFLRTILWVLSDQSLGFCVHGGRSSGESRWFHKHAVAWGASEVHSALDCPVVLTHCQVQHHANPNPLGEFHTSNIVDCSSPLPHPHLLSRGHPVRKLRYRGALVPAGVPRGLCTAGVRAGTRTPVRQISLCRLTDGRFTSSSLGRGRGQGCG